MRTLRGLVALGCVLLVMAGGLFVPAGTLAWARGWRFYIAFFAAVLLALTVLRKADPEIFSARSRVQPGTRVLDYVFIAAIFIGFLAILPVSALDYRYHLAQVPEWLSWASYLPLMLGFAGQVWAEAVNRHFEPGVRLQNDRGQAVIATGPYATVRHPGYVSGAVMILSMPLCLGSLWGLLPALLTALALIPRTIFEERVLSAGLPGYTAYMTRTGYRWLPGIW